MAKVKKAKKLGKFFSNFKKYVKENPVEVFLIFFILVLGAFLRLYKIDEYMTFLGDEGRDVIVVRRLLVSLDPILVGPGTSIGNMYLGPLYYYMMAPSLWLANYSPVGPAVMIALLGVFTIWFVYHIGKEWFGKWAGIVAALLYAISPTVIIYSRSSWNPNIMPFFALLTIYAIWKIWKEKKWGWLIVAGISYAFVLQSHYLGLLLIPVIGLFWLISLINVWKDLKQRKKMLVNSFIGLFLFALLMSPLVIFDARHGWRNARAMHEFFAKRQTTVSARPWTAIPNLPELVEKATARIAGGKNEIAGKWVALGIIVSALSLFTTRFKTLKKERRVNPYFLLFAWLGVAFIGFGVYKQEIYDHYYGIIFAAPSLLIGGLFQDIKDWANRQKKAIEVVLLAILLSLVAYLAVLNLQENPLKYEPNKQLQRTKVITAKMVDGTGGERFNIAVVAERNYEGAYQYFLEKSNAPFVIIDPQRADETITEQLFVVCELEDREKCQPTSNPKAEIANFGWSKIEDQWEVAGVVLYKLVHNVP
jgi:4-amino-4-deoxy-L-arabinose transferase-like glycosyltransferase